MLLAALYLAVIRSRGNQIVVERVPAGVQRDVGAKVAMELNSLPVGVQNDGSVASTQWDALGELAPFLKRDNRKSSATTSFPIDRDVLRVDLNAP